MKKLNDIPKKNIFNVPEGYFDKLPTVIQSRIAENAAKKDYRFSFRTSLQYALPVVALVVIGLFWYNLPQAPVDIESILASVETEDLIAYLNESDISTEELLDATDFDAEDLEDIESEIYGVGLNDPDYEGINLIETPITEDDI